MSNEITEVTRRAIIDYFNRNKISWSGRLSEVEFLGRLYNLIEMPSTDHRQNNALGDIWLHRERNIDWDDDWVFYDDRFNLLKASDKEFLDFLCETIHPVVRADEDEVNSLLSFYNEVLSKDGWELIEQTRISGKPVFIPKRIGQEVVIFEQPTGWEKVDRQIQEVKVMLENASNEEQFQAVGLLCREVLITLAQTVYVQEKHGLIDDVIPSDSDAKRMLQAFINTELKGSQNKKIRSHVKEAINLALALQHDRNADYRKAAICAEATKTVINFVSILSGRRR